MGLIKASDGFLACPQSFGGVKDTRETFAELLVKQYEEKETKQ